MKTIKDDIIARIFPLEIKGVGEELKVQIENWKMKNENSAIIAQIFPLGIKGAGRNEKHKLKIGKVV